MAEEEGRISWSAELSDKGFQEGARRMQQEINRITQEVDKSGVAVDRFTDEMDDMADSTRKVKREADDLSSSFGSLTKYAAGFFSLAAAKSFAQKVFDVRSEIQSLQTSFETLVGNKPQAEELFNSIREFAVKTPMQMKDLASSAQTMMSFNIPVEQIMENLKALGDVSMGDEQKFQSLSLAFSQMSATGKLMGQDLLQMINAGFNPLATISEKTGKSIGQLKEEMEKGAISADMVRQAFIDATSEGGKFYGMLEAQSKTLRGAYSNLQGAIDDMFNSIGEQSEGIMAGAIDAATFLVQNYEKVGKAILFVVATYGEYKAAVMVNIALEKAQAFNRLASTKGLTAMQLATSILTEKTKALNAVLMKNPYVLVATAVMSAVSAYMIFARRADTAANKAKLLQEELKNQDYELGENRASLQRLQTEWKNLTSDKEKKQWIVDNKDEFHNLGIEIGTVQEAENAFVNNSSAIIQAMELRAKAAAYAAMATRSYQAALENREAAKAGDNGMSIKDAGKGVLRNGIYGLPGLFRSVRTSWRNAQADTEEENAKEYLAEQKKLNEQADKLMKDAKIKQKQAESASSKTKSKNKKTGSGTDHTEEQEAQRRQQLFELRMREMENQAKEEAELESACADLVIASERNAATRERLQREKDHKDRLDEIKRQADEWKKQNYEAAKDQWEATNKDKTKVFSDTDAGKGGWQAQSLTDTQKAVFEALVAKENQDWENLQRETVSNLIAAHQSYTDQKIAIDREYSDQVRSINEAIVEAEKRGDTESVEALRRSLAEAASERAKAQADLSLNQLKETPEYVRAFEDLANTSTETIEILIQNFENAKEAAAGSMDPKDLKEFTDALQQMYDELDSRDPWKAMKSSLEEVKTAHRDVIKAERDLKVIQSGGIVTVRNYDRELDKFVDTVVTEEEAMKKVAKAKDKEAKANTKYKKASKEARAVIDDLASSIQNVGGAIGGMAGEIISLIGDVTSVVNGALHAMENTSQGASAAIQAAEKASAILAIISAAIQVIQKISGLVKNLFGANDAKDYEKAKQRYENLVSIWDEMIEKKREYLNESWGKEVMGAEEEARALLKIEEEQIRLLAQQRLKVTNGSHSMWYRMWKGSYKFDGQNWQDVAQEISSALGVAFNSMEDMTYMTSEQLQWIKEHYVGLWSVMDGDFRDHLEKIIKFADTEADIIDEAMERMTGTRAEDVFSDFMDQLYELADGSEDVMQEIADNWQQMVNRMTINNLIGNKMKADLEEWYQQLADLNTRRASGGMTNEEYKAELDRLSALYDSYVQNGKEQIEQFRDMGIIKSIVKEEEEAAEEVKGYLDSVRSSFQQLVSDSEIDIDKWTKDLRNTILRNLMESKLLDEEFDKWATEWSERYYNILNAYDGGNIQKSVFDGLMDDLMAEFNQRTGEIADRSKQMWEAFGFSEETEEEVVEEAKSAFDNLHSSFLSTLTDIKGDAEKWSKDITKTMVEQMVEKNILNDAFDGKMDDWRERFENALTAGDTAGLKALRQELYDLRATLAEQAQSYMEALGYMEEVADEIAETVETPLDDLRSMFRSNLLDMKADAEDLGEDIGRALSSAFIDQFVLGDTFDRQVEDWKKQYEAIMGGGMTPEQRAAQLSQLKKTIADAREGYAEQARLIHDLVGTAEYGDQQASVNMADKATYDQFEMFLGMQTAMMIGQEQGNAVRVQILNTLQAMGGITSPNSGLAEQLRNMMMLSNEYLLDIKRSNREIQSEFGSVLNSINNKLSRL